MQTKSRLAALLVAGATFVSIHANAGNAAAPLLTTQQKEVDRSALSLRDEPAVQAARAAMVKRWQALQPYTTADGRAQLESAVDEAVFIALRAGAVDPANPQVVWTEAPAYEIDGLQVPSSRSGDSPDRIYRFAGVDPRYRYVIQGRRSAKPSLAEFSFEALQRPAVFGKPVAALSSANIDVAGDGTFSVTVDSAPANGRRNHLQLPPGSTSLLIRDTLADWSSQLPNELRIERIGGDKVPQRSHAQVVADASDAINALAEIAVQFFEWPFDRPANQLQPRLRPMEWGLKGSGLALNRFSIKPDEALIVTLDPVGARYVGFVVGDPWQRSVNYWQRSGSLNNLQAQPNEDGTLTYVLSAQDPGVHNWVDTGGLQDGVVTVRWEGLPANVQIEKGFREAHIVKRTEVANALPNAKRVIADQRREWLAARESGYEQRVLQ